MTQKFLRLDHDYFNSLKSLRHAEVGRLILACMEYSITGTVNLVLGRPERPLFIMMKEQMDRIDAKEQDQRENTTDIKCASKTEDGVILAVDGQKDVVCVVSNGVTDKNTENICKNGLNENENDLFADEAATSNAHTISKSLKSKSKHKNKKTLLKHIGDLDEKKNMAKTWRDDFEIYQGECFSEYEGLIYDPDWIKEQERLNPGVDILLTLEKAVKNFWGTEAGWQHKKRKKAKTICWRSTFTNAININRVWKTKGRGG